MWTATPLFEQKAVFRVNEEKAHQHVQSSHSQTSTDNERFPEIYLNIAGLLQPPNIHRFLLTCIDCFTCCPVAVSTTNTSSETVPKAFLYHWISTYGILLTVITDRGVLLEYKLFADFFTLLGLKHSQDCISPFV